MIGVMITNGGAHSAAYWAEATASHIVDVAPSATGARREGALSLQFKIAEILRDHHANVQEGERAAIQEHGHARLAHDLDPEHHVCVADIVQEIIAAAVGTPWEADFAYPGQPERDANPDDPNDKGDHYIASFAENLTGLLNQHFRSNQHIERRWHADRNPNAKECKAFRKTHNIGG